MIHFSDQLETSQKACHWSLNKTITFDMLRRCTTWYLKQSDPFEVSWRRTVHHLSGFKSLSSLLLNHVPSVQIIIQNCQRFQNVWSSNKTKVIFYCWEEVHLRFEGVPRSTCAQSHCHKTALAFITNRPVKKHER